MAEIIYFGTNKCSRHYPLGIDKTLTVAEYDIWRECDNETCEKINWKAVGFSKENEADYTQGGYRRFTKC